LIWSFGRTHTKDDVADAFHYSLDAGINFIDTAESYGSGRSERILGELIPSSGTPVVLATKFMPFPWRIGAKSMQKALEASLQRLKLSSVDLYQIHFPLPPVSIETWADALAEMVSLGLVRAVGVSNFSEIQMRRASTTLAKRGIPLASNQVEYSLLKRSIEWNGLLKTCHDLGISVISYSPLAKGALTGKYSTEKPMPGIRSTFYPRAYINKIQSLIRLMREIGQAHDGKTPAQVALNWCIYKVTIPIPGAKNLRQAEENSGGLGWRLTEEDVAALDKASEALN
jgi:aryl-alcohol dehydrogenase-like predicted oxidoreductase